MTIQAKLQNMSGASSTITKKEYEELNRCPVKITDDPIEQWFRIDKVWYRTIKLSDTTWNVLRFC